MTKQNKISLSFIMLLFIFSLVYKFYLLDKIPLYAETVTSAIFIILTFISIILLGLKSEKKTRISNKIFKFSCVIVLIFFLISYLLGFLLGFLNNESYSSFLTTIDKVFAPLMYVIFAEVFRYVIISNNNRKNSKIDKRIIYLLTATLSILEIFIAFENVKIRTFELLFFQITSRAIPIIVKNATLSYLAYNIGYKQNILYRIIMDGYIYVMPIIPDLGYYLTSMINIATPCIIYIYAFSTVDEEYNGVENSFESPTIQLLDIPVIAVMIIFICLISNFFTYFFIGIGSESMTPNINKGDGIIGHKIKNKDDLKVGKVIIFKAYGRYYVHRLKKIEQVNGVTYYRTKGDANRTNDNINTTYEDIKGVVDFRIRYIAWPSVFISEFWKKEL